MGAIFALGPSLGAPKEPGDPILSHLGRVPFWTLILDPKNHKKKSISKVHMWPMGSQGQNFQNTDLNKPAIFSICS